MFIFLLGIGIYAMLMLLIGWLAGRRVKTLDDYLVAGRRLPMFLAVPTIVATWFGAGSAMGVSGTVYAQGFYGVLADPFGCSLALVIAGLFFAAPFRRLKLMTISDLLGRAFGKRFERVATWLMVPFYIGTLASQMVGMGYVFEIVSGGSPQVGIYLGSAIVVLYTFSGGMWAVTVTDFIQFTLLTIGMCLLLPICFTQIPDRTALNQQFIQEFATLVPQGQSHFDWLSYAGRILMTSLGAILGQDLIQRSLASRSESIARRSAIWGGLFYFLLGLIPLYIGLAGREILPDLAKPEQLMPLLAQQFLSPLAFTLFACGLLSAIMSTADSYLLAGTSLVTHNLLLPHLPSASESQKLYLVRAVNIGFAVLALGVALCGPTIFDLMVHTQATLFVAIFVPASAALFLKHSHPLPAWAAVLGGGGAWISYLVYHMQALAASHEDVLFAAAAFGGAASAVSYVVTWALAGRQAMVELREAT